MNRSRMFSVQVGDCRDIVLSAWKHTDDDEIGHEVMALTDQDGFIPGQIYHRPLPTMPELRMEHREFITGWTE